MEKEQIAVVKGTNRLSGKLLLQWLYSGCIVQKEPEGLGPTTWYICNVYGFVC